MKMSFKLFIENTKMDPWKAMEVLGITNLAGQDYNTHEEEVKKAYRDLAMASHPDRTSGNDQATIRFKDAAEAYDSIQDFQGKRLPQGAGDTGSGDFLGNKKQKSYSLADVQAFVQQVFAHQLTDYFIRTPYQGYDLMGRVGYMPYGSKQKTAKIPPEATPEQTVQGFQRMIPGFPDSIIDITFIDIPQRKPPKEGWITWQRGNNTYQSVSFEAHVRKAKKEAGVGMPVDQIISHLKEKGLQFLGGGHKNHYYGLAEAGEGYFIRIKAKTIRLIRRYRNNGLEDKGVTNEFYFGAMTPALLDQLIALLKKKMGQLPEAD
jgi:hypothetical protein